MDWTFELKHEGNKSSIIDKTFPSYMFVLGIDSSGKDKSIENVRT